MKKIALLFVCMLSLNTYARERVMFYAYEYLQAPIIDPTPIKTGPQRSPGAEPEIYYEDGFLDFTSCHPTYIITLLQDDEVAYTTIVSQDEPNLQLPDSLSGEYELQLETDNLVFFGNIVL